MTKSQIKSFIDKDEKLTKAAKLLANKRGKEYFTGTRKFADIVGFKPAEQSTEGWKPFNEVIQSYKEVTDIDEFIKELEGEDRD
jgi:predicted DNA-binding WGR domain protein